MTAALVGMAALVVMTNPRAAGSHCTGRKADVDLSPAPTQVESLRRLPRPLRGHQSSRTGRTSSPVRVDARLVAMWRVPGRQIDLAVSALRKPGATMVVTFPSPACDAKLADGADTSETKRARSELITACGAATGGVTRLEGVARIAGSELLDGRAARYSAPNGVRLDPVTGFLAPSCRIRA